ncbi:MAG TPA: protein phosphatase 2C domain-containing protein [Ktedonobacterales bacterium]
MAPGTRLGQYTVGRVVSASAGRRLYTATADPTGDQGPGGGEPVLLAEVTALTPFVTELITMHLQHPRLLAPRATFTADGASFIVLEGLPATTGTIALAADPGAYVTAQDALRAGAGLADALAYLHRNGLAHMHVSTDEVLLQDNRAFLCGLESATTMEGESTDPTQLVATDANALASTLSGLAHVSAEPGGHESQAVVALREIAVRGKAEQFAMPDDVATACGSAILPDRGQLPAGSGETAGGRFVIHAATSTSVGLVRSENQDAAVSMSLDLLDDVHTGTAPLGIYLVADGMGGEAHGELASRIAARVVTTEILRRALLLSMVGPAIEASTGDKPLDITTTGLAQALAQAVITANQHVRDLAMRLGQDTGSTLTAIVSYGSQAVLAHLGDSRAYLLRDGKMHQLTDDHTLLAKLQMMDHPILYDNNFYVPRNFLYRSLGQDQAAPDLTDFTLSPGDRLMLCSDGLWDELSDEVIQQTMAAASDPQACAQELVRLTNEAGGNDNSTAVVVFAGEVLGEQATIQTDDTQKLTAHKSEAREASSAD